VNLLYTAGAFGLGAMHALEPGHGKSIVAAYLVGQKGRTRDAMFLGAVVTITYTTTFVVLAAAAGLLTVNLDPHVVESWVAAVAGVAIVGIGIWMVFRSARQTEHSHNHDHRHSHKDGGHHHSEAVGTVSYKELLTLEIAGGVVP